MFLIFALVSLLLLIVSIIGSSNIPDFEAVRSEVTQKFETIKKLLPENVKERIIEILIDFNAFREDNEEKSIQLKTIYKKIKSEKDHFPAISQFFWKLSGYLEQIKLTFFGINDGMTVYEFDKFKFLIKNCKWATFCSKAINLLILKVALKSKGSKSRASELSLEEIVKLTTYSQEAELNLIFQSIKEEIDPSNIELYRFFLVAKKEQLTAPIRWLSISIAYGDEETINRAIIQISAPVDKIMTNFSLS